MSRYRLLSGILLAVYLNAQTPTQVDWLTQVRRKEGYPVSQNAAATNGGYMVFSPITYNPYDGGTCLDKWGNPVQQPIPSPGQAPFGPNDLVIWNSLSPSMPYNPGQPDNVQGLVQDVIIGQTGGVTGAGPCGIPLPVNQLYGVNTNGYFFGRAGLATDTPKYNAIQALQGGVTANSITMGVLYPAGTITTTGVLGAPAYLGGHVDSGHSVGPPSAGTIATTTNPFSGGEGLVAGQIYFDDGLHCERVYTGSAWQCMGPSGGPPGGPLNAIQFNNDGSGATGTFDGSVNLTWDNSTGNLASCITLAGACTFTSGFNGQTFSSSADSSMTGTLTTAGTNVTLVSQTAGPQFSLPMVGGFITINSVLYQVAGFANATHITLSTSAGTQTAVPYSFGNGFQTRTGTAQITGSGFGLFQGVVAHTFNSQADVFGGNAFQTSTGNAAITGAGAALFQSAAVTNAFNSLADVSVAGTVSTSGTAVTQTAGSLFVSGMVGGNMTINHVLYRVGGFTDSTHVTLSTSAGSQSGVPYSFGNAFQTSTGTMQITGSGVGLFQDVIVHSVFNSQADVNGGNAFQTSTGTMSITGAGDAAFQSLALTNGWTAGGGAYRLTAGGALTVASCTGCGGGGGGGTPGTPVNSVQFNNPLGTFAGNVKFTFNSSTGVLDVCGTLGGICNAASGVVAQVFSSSATGGATAYTDGGANFTITGAGNAAFQSLALTNGWTAGAGAYGISAGGALTVASCSGCASGGGSAAAPATSVQFNTSGNLNGNANFTWNNASQLLLVTGVASTAAIDSVNGFIQSDGGFVVSASNNYNSIHTTASGGMAGRSYTASAYVQTGNSSGAPVASPSDALHAGALYYDTGAACEELYNGSAWACLAGGGSGVTSFNSRTGVVSLTKADVTAVEGQGLGPGDNVNFNTITVLGCTGCGGGGGGVTSFTGFGAPRTGAVVLVNNDITTAVGQPLTVSSVPQFAGINLTSTLNGTGAAFSTTLNHNGITGPGGISGGSFAISGTTIIDPSQNVNVVGHLNTAAGFQVSGVPGVTSVTCSQFTLGICTAP